MITTRLPYDIVVKTEAKDQTWITTIHDSLFNIIQTGYELSAWTSKAELAGELHINACARMLKRIDRYREDQELIPFLSSERLGEIAAQAATLEDAMAPDGFRPAGKSVVRMLHTTEENCPTCNGTGKKPKVRTYDWSAPNGPIKEIVDE